MSIPFTPATRNQQTIHDTIVEEWLDDDHTPNIPEHLRDVMCGKTLHHTDGTISWCTRKPGHDGDCRTGWQPTTQPLGHHGNQN